MTKADLIALINGTLNNSVADGSITPDTVASLLRDMVDFTDDNDFDSVILYKARLVQSGTSAPVLTEYINNTGLTIGSSYSSVGNYSLTGFTDSKLLEGYVELTMSDGLLNGDTVSLGVDSGFNVITITTHDSSGTVKNGALVGVMGDDSPRHCILTLKKYPIVS